MTTPIAHTAPPGAQRRAPPWFRAAASFGTLWNGFGVFQFAHAVTATRDSLMAMGMTEVQAQTMSSYPAWMTAAFAIGTLGGLLGCALLLLRRRIAVPVFRASLVGYGILYLGDSTEGVFAAIGMSQVVILSFVVAIACAFLWMARRAARVGLLT